MASPGDSKVSRSPWARARGMAKQTPPQRNRYVDFLRALSILAVVVGHWLVAAPHMQDGTIVGGHLLGILPWAQWLTWGFQVMPLFFLVGGFSNGVSWEASRRAGGTYAGWFGSRVQRLINPVLPLFLIWTVFAAFGTALGLERRIVAMVAQLALIPVWFLSVYLLVSAVVPWTHALWSRFGLASFWGFVAAAVAVDAVSLGMGLRGLHLLNFGFVWLAIHQLGYAWGAGRFADRRRALAWAAGGLVALVLLVAYGPYPVAMIGVPGSGLSNSMPPTVALLALGITQAGLALAVEDHGRRLLENLAAWTAVVLVNGMIMTIYLWHLTAFVLVVTVAWLLGGVGLDVQPGTGAWWVARPAWFALYTVVLLPLILTFARAEQARGQGAADGLPLWRIVLGVVLICIGLAATAAISIASPLGVTGVRLWVVALPFIGAALFRFGPAHRLVRRGT